DRSGRGRHAGSAGAGAPGARRLGGRLDGRPPRWLGSLLRRRAAGRDRGPPLPGRGVAWLRVYALLRAGCPPRPGRYTPRRGTGGSRNRGGGRGERPAADRRRCGPGGRSGHNRRMKLLRMTPGKGDVLLAEGDPTVAEDE